MLGIIFFEFRQYVLLKYGIEKWEELCTLTQSHHDYISHVIYPDEEWFSLLKGFSKITDRSCLDIEEDMGIFSTPFLLKMSKTLIQPEWVFKDLILHVQDVIHDHIKHTIKVSTVPFLQVQEDSPHQLTILYSSPRHMCAFGKGIIKGLAQHYNTSISIEQPECMHRGDNQCRLVITLLDVLM